MRIVACALLVVCACKAEPARSTATGSAASPPTELECNAYARAAAEQVYAGAVRAKPEYEPAQYVIEEQLRGGLAAFCRDRLPAEYARCISRATDETIDACAELLDPSQIDEQYAKLSALTTTVLTSPAVAKLIHAAP